MDSQALPPPKGAQLGPNHAQSTKPGSFLELGVYPFGGPYNKDFSIFGGPYNKDYSILGSILGTFLGVPIVIQDYSFLGSKLGSPCLKKLPP